MKKSILLGSLAAWIGLGPACTQTSSTPDSGTCHSINLGSILSVGVLLELSNAFFVGRFDDIREVASTDVFGQDGTCPYRMRLATIVEPGSIIYATTNMDGFPGDIVASVEPTCSPVVEEEIICDPDAGLDPADREDGGCWRVVHVGDCIPPSWAYVIPEASTEMWAVFAVKEPQPNEAGLPMQMRLRFPVRDEVVDIRALDGGREIPLAEIEALLRENSKPDCATFWCLGNRQPG